MSDSDLQEEFLKCKRYVDRNAWGELRDLLARTPALKSFSNGDDSLLFYARDVSTSAMLEVVRCGVDPNISYMDGTTVLMDFTSLGDLEVIRFLLRHGSDVNMVASCGETAFSWSCVSDQLECAKELYSHGGRWDSPVATSTDLVERYGSGEFKAWIADLI